MNLQDLVLSNPWLLAVLTVAVLAVVAYQRTLTYREYRTAHVVKSLVFRVLDPLATRRGRPLLAHVDGATHPEFLRTYPATPRETFRRLRAGGFDPHLVATTKVRSLGNGQREVSHSQLVYYHDDGTQTEAYLFPAGHGNTTDVYAHHETSVTDPAGHLTDKQTDGDARNVVTETLAKQAAQSSRGSTTKASSSS